VDPVPTRQETEMNIPALYACAGRLCVNNNKCRLVDGVHLSSFPYLTIETFSKTVVANMQKEFAKKICYEKKLFGSNTYLDRKANAHNHPSVFLWFIINS
jgi:hypothetical protein